MFSTIFLHELKYWLKKPVTYIYATIFFVLAVFMSASTAGIFDFLTVSAGSSKIVNSPLGINGLFSGLTVLVFFLFPSIIGVSVYRDYKSEMHTILYSYPFTKFNYLFAKFLSSLTIVTLIVLSIGVGMAIGFRLPGTNQEIVGAFHIMSYLNAYVVFIIPNVFLFGAIVFAVVTFTRNISAGFITVVVLMFIQGLTAGLLSEEEHRFIAALVDPFGEAATSFYTRYWTVAEQNELSLPIKEMVIYNRLLWMTVASVVFGLVYKYFSFSQNALTFSFKKVKSERATKSNFG